MATILATSLSPEECRRRLREAVASDLAFFDGRPVKGTIGPAGFGISKKLPVIMRNSFQTRLRGRMERLPGGGTRITCTSGMYVSTMLFMAIWFGALLLFFLVGNGTALASLIGQRSAADELVALETFPLAMMAGGVLVVLIGRLLSIGQRSFLLHFLERTLEARAD